MSLFATVLRTVALSLVLTVGAGAEGFSGVPLHEEAQPLSDIAFADAARLCSLPIRG